MIKVLSIEIGSGLTRVLEMDFKVKNPKIYNFFDFETPKDMENDGSVKVNESFQAMLKAGLREHKIKTEKVVFTVNSGRIAVREVMVPMVKEKMLKGLIMANIEEYFPVDLSQYELGYRIMERIEEKDAKKYKVSLMAMPNELINSYKQLASSMGLTLMGLDYVGNSLIQIIKREKQEDTQVYVKIDEETSLVLIFKDGKVVLQRTISYGIKEAMEELQKSNVYGEHLSYVDAINILRRKTCIRRHMDVAADYKEEEDTGIEMTTVRAEITETLRPVIGNVSRILDYYISRNEGIQIKNISLIGLGADFSGLSKLMTNELEMKVVSIQKFSQVEISKNTEEETFKIAEYAAGIGAAFEPLFGEEIRSGQELKKAGMEKQNSLRVPMLVCGLCVLTALGLGVYSAASGLVLKNEQKTMEEKIKKLTHVQTTFDQYTAAKVEYDDIKTMYQLTENKNSQFLTLLGEMEARIPSAACVVSLSVDGESVSMDILVGTKEEAAATIMQLRELTTLGTVQTSGISEITDENGITQVTFSVTCTYTEPTQPEEKDAGTTQPTDTGAGTTQPTDTGANSQGEQP
ncbi:MAG: pilus assembly protein PilM [Lachnospiraceae bacterium]